MSIATKTGDDGSTALMYGRRLSKNDPRVWAYGTVDELNAALGWVRATVADPFVTDPVLAIQKELVALMGELALHPDDQGRYEKAGYRLDRDRDGRPAHRIMDDLEKNHRIRYKGWATPGRHRRLRRAGPGADHLPPGGALRRGAGGHGPDRESRHPRLFEPPLRSVLALGSLGRDQVLPIEPQA